MTFYIPEGTRLVTAEYVYPDGAGGFDPIPIKGQSIIAIGSGPVGSASTPSLVGLNLGPNLIGRTEAAVDAGGTHRGTIAGVYADTGILHSRLCRVGCGIAIRQQSEG